MEVNSWFALLSFLAALLAALYAKWSATAARRQNEISIHNEKLKVFKALLDFRSKLSAYGTDVLERDLYLELFPYVQLAEFYYSDAASAELNTFFSLAREMIDLRELAKSTKDTETIKKTQTLFQECRAAANRVEKTMKAELRLVKTQLPLPVRLLARVRNNRPRTT